MKKDFDTRMVAGGLELRDDPGGGRPKLVGYAAVFNSKSVDLGGFIEYIRPGAFKRSLAAGADVRALVNHNPDLIIGRSSAGTLVLAEDERGLRFEITPPDTQAGRDVIENVRAGNLSGNSFAFVAVKETWDTKTTPAVREVLDCDVFDVSVVAYPAYPKTEVALRSLGEVVKKEADELRNAKEAEATRAKASADARERDLKLRGRGEPRAVPTKDAALRHFMEKRKTERRDASFQDRIAAVWGALYDMLGYSWSEDGESWYMVATFDDRVILETTPGKYFMYPITFGAQNTVTIGAPTAVEQKWEPIAGSAA